MPTSKHRKKGQKKAVKRPGRARLVQEPADVRQERQLEAVALDRIGADALDDDAFDLLMFALEMVFDEVLALNVDGTRLVPCVGSRGAVVAAFCDAFERAFGKVPGFEARDDKRAAADGWLDRLAEVGFLAFEGDQVMLAVEVPAMA